MPQISIIAPVYNVEQYLGCCIDSILQQSYTDYELLLINDGSTDSSGEVCNKYAKKDSRIRVFHKSNRGLSSARNIGLDNAKGEYVIFIDSDDYWQGVEALKHLYETITKFNADVVRGEYISIDEFGNIIKTLTQDKSEIEYKLLDSAMFYRKAICGENFSWLYLFRRKAISQLRFDEDRKFQEDIDFNIKFFSKHRMCVYSSQRFYVYRKRLYSIVTTPKIENLEGSFSLCYVFDKYSKLALDENLKAIYRYNSIMMYYWTLETLSHPPYFNDRLHIIEKLSLVDLNKTVRKWANTTKKIYPLPIYISPILGVYYFRLKFMVGAILRRLRII